MRVMPTGFVIIAAILASATALAEPEPTQTDTEMAGAQSAPPSSKTSNSIADAAREHSALVPVAPEIVDQIPALKHLAKSGAQLFEAGTAHGLRSIVARQHQEFMILQVTPDGEAIVSGVQSDLSVDQLLSIAGGGEPQVMELGSTHGLRGLLVRNGQSFQVFYATPDGGRVIPGVMWDSSGKNITRQQVAPIPGVTPTVTIGREKQAGASAGASGTAGVSGLEAARGTTFGLIGADAAPRMYVFVDPLCGYSVRALQQLQPFVAMGRAQAAIIPISVLDYEDEGRSTKAALAMLTKPVDQMVQAWSRGDLSGPASKEADEKLRRNMAAAESIGLRGTPTVIWRKADGSEGRIDGLPEDWNAVISSMGGESHAAR